MTCLYLEVKINSLHETLDSSNLLRASVWSKSNGGRGPRGPLRWIRHYHSRVPRQKERFKISTDAKFG